MLFTSLTQRSTHPTYSTTVLDPFLTCYFDDHYDVYGDGEGDECNNQTKTQLKFLENCNNATYALEQSHCTVVCCTSLAQLLHILQMSFTEIFSENWRKLVEVEKQVESRQGRSVGGRRSRRQWQVVIKVQPERFQPLSPNAFLPQRDQEVTM